LGVGLTVTDVEGSVLARIGPLARGQEPLASDGVERGLDSFADIVHDMA
jgi:hypothetical protein